MVACNVIAADTDAEARRLFTSAQQAFTNMLRGTRGRLQPPIDDIESYWTPPEKAQASRMLACSFVGGPETVRKGLEAFIAETESRRAHRRLRDLRSRGAGEVVRGAGGGERRDGPREAAAVRSRHTDQGSTSVQADPSEVTGVSRGERRLAGASRYPRSARRVFPSAGRQSAESPLPGWMLPPRPDRTVARDRRGRRRAAPRRPPPAPFADALSPVSQYRRAFRIR